MRLLIATLVLVTCLQGCGRDNPITAQRRLDAALQVLTGTDSAERKFYALSDAAKESFVLGHQDNARKFATELLGVAPQYRRNWNYGNAIHDGNMVLGRIALKEGRKSEAIRYLRAAGDTPGSPQLGSFGPNMNLAKDLLDQSEREAVLDYFAQCRRFWELGGESLSRWTSEVQQGKVPDFGANLVY